MIAVICLNAVYLGNETSVDEGAMWSHSGTLPLWPPSTVIILFD